LTLSVLWGLPYLFIRVAVRQLDPGTLVMARTLPAAIILVPVALHQGAFGTLRGAWRWLVAYSFIEFGVPWLLMSSAERHLTSSLTSLLVCCVPLVALGLGRVIHPHEHIAARRLWGLAVGTVGVALLVGLDVTSGSAPWILAMGGVVLGYACGPMIISLRLTHASGVGVVAASISIVALVYLPWGATHWPSHVNAETIWAVVGLALLCTLAAFLVFFQLIKEVGPSRATVITYLNTAVAVILGVVVLGEPLTDGIIVGFPMIVAGSVLATSSSAKTRPETLADRDQSGAEIADL
jgi:drug/metabolite transporter (DMT)-like permease